MALSVIAASSAEQHRSPKGVNSSTAGLLASAAVSASNRRFSASSSSTSSSTSSTASSLPYNNSKQSSQLSQAQDLRVLPQQLQPPAVNRRRKAPEDYVDEHEDLEVRDGRLMCKYCSLVIGAARNPSGSNNDASDSAGLSRSSRIREHLQSKRHVVQKQLQLMNVAAAATPASTQQSPSPFLTAQILTNPTAAVDLLMSSAKQSFFDMPLLGGVGAVDQLKTALKSAACVIDAEISDIDERIGQLQMQIDQLRAKKAKLAGHKSDINRSLAGVTSTAGQTMPTPSSKRPTVAASPLPSLTNNNNNLLSTLPGFTPTNFGQLHRSAGDILQELTSSFVSPQFNNTAFNAILASAAESASALMSMAASQQQTSKPAPIPAPALQLNSLLSSVIDASQAEDSSLSEGPTKNPNEQDSGNGSSDDNGLFCLSLAAAAATPQPTTDSASSGGNNSSTGGSRRKTLKPTRLTTRNSSRLNVEANNNVHDGASSTSPTDLSFPNADDQTNNNRLMAVTTPCDDDSPLSLVKYEQRDQSVFPNAAGVHSPFACSAIADDARTMEEVDRPTTPEIQQYNPALADKRFRGKAVQYCLLRRFNDHEVYSNWIRLQKVTRDKRTDTETGVKDFFRCPYARKIGWQPCPFRMYALFRPDAPGQITVFRSEVDHYHAQLPSDSSVNNSGGGANICSDANITNNMSSEDGGDGTRISSRANAICSSNSNHSDAIEPCE